MYEEKQNSFKNTKVAILFITTNTMYVCIYGVDYYGLVAVVERTGYQNICEYIIGVCVC
jgi:hypothetical protein